MPPTSRAAKDKARKAEADARRARSTYRSAKAHAKRKSQAKSRRHRKRSRRGGRSWIPRTIGVIAYLALGLFPYLASGLLVPPGAVVVLMVVWTIGLVITIDLSRRSTGWTLMAPVLALAFWAGDRRPLVGPVAVSLDRQAARRR
jgi:Flp pilus assembly protein TadB